MRRKSPDHASAPVAVAAPVAPLNTKLHIIQTPKANANFLTLKDFESQVKLLQ